MSPVKLSPAQMGSLNFTVESNDHPGGVSRLSVECRGPHKIAAAGNRALLSRLNTYYGTTLSAAQVATLLANMPFAMSLIDLGQTGADFFVQTADVAALTTGIATDLQSAAAVVSG